MQAPIELKMAAYEVKMILQRFDHLSAPQRAQAIQYVLSAAAGYNHDTLTIEGEGLVTEVVETETPDEINKDTET